MQNSAPRRSERESNFELLRIVAMFLVVLYHASGRARGLAEDQGFSTNPFFFQLCSFCGDLGNSLFVLISGYFLAGRSFSARRVARLWMQTLFWSVLLTALALAAGRSFSIREVWRGMTPVFSITYWFITCYLIFCFFQPYMDRLLDTLDRREFRRLLVVMFVVFSLLRTVVPGDFVHFTKMTMFFFLYSITAYLRRYPDAVGVFDRAWRCFAAAGALALLLIGYFALCLRFGDRISSLRLDRFNHMATLPQLAMALLIFLGFRALRMPHSRLVNRLATACLGVYLIHYSYAWRDWIWHTLFGALPMNRAAAIIPCLLLAVVLVYALCTLLELLRLRFVEPVCMRLIDRIPPVRRELERAARR